ncbi:protein EFFECTOR OF TRANSCRIPTION 2-like [Senna tora]|uniref:Protein EFFECTOR OF TRANSCRIPTION 2-like n=1 Tax=Senna tora TaxID=362788 RepID=A0A834T433_9FABA|nr:protein EFFECTOR OF TRANSCRIPTION 2-like [Senna tora]
MVAGDLCSVIPRLKREECKRTKHDPNFSDWKILIGPSDWEDYSKGKEGSAKYRIHNLPEKSVPGVYELGIAVFHSGLGRKINKLDPDHIVVVYLGEADNVRTRLQRYGRTGAHLGNSCSSYDPDDCYPASIQKGVGLFEEIFSQGYPIIYRWAPMQNKEDAKKTESQLLSVFDYAWNTSNNGSRRPDDILQKLKKISSGPRSFSNMARVLLPFTQKKVGIQIKSCNLPPPNDKLHEIDEGSYNFLSRVFKFNRSTPRIVQENNTRFCGVALGDGSVCRRPPAERRLRCSEHKGMRTNGATAKTIREMKSETTLDLNNNVNCQKMGKDYGEQNVSLDVVDLPKAAVESTLDESITNICGIILNDGTPCRTPPVKGRKRCHEHKGKRIHVSMHKPVIVGNSQFLKSAISEQTALEGPLDETTIANTCGIILNDGSPCRRPPVKGRKSLIEDPVLGDGFCCTTQSVRRQVIYEKHYVMRTPSWKEDG